LSGSHPKAPGFAGGYLHQLREREVLRISELLEIPVVVACTDLLGLMTSSMRSLMEERLGLQVLEIPMELPVLPIYMIWHVTRRLDAAHAWLREVVATELGVIAKG
jgi:DNA-binding transcriptional LysR family regulator